MMTDSKKVNDLAKKHTASTFTAYFHVIHSLLVNLFTILRTFWQQG